MIFKILFYFFPSLLDVVHSILLNRVDDSLASLGSGPKASGMWRERYFTVILFFFFRFSYGLIFYVLQNSFDSSS